ncbi:uncharacterized protein EI97DRAFT_467401 [Westerdykella ornata]|uniref:L domain-like protein n=1 Tax=Westerdykella ornata TaxID=318751 RepID=A0A6A6JHN7_WESOR|nr:uncharacterized protein EI97DRAFT_467401 [Westerdykella ornata]KAF2276170.1 hypothetical protein EI97DRAFT_467401 [Westerdykella ornata]
MKPWLDDLSEEWVEPDPPADDVKDMADSSVMQISQSVPPKPRSRLPRLRHSSGSFSEIQVRHIARDPRSSRPTSVLAARSPNGQNIMPVVDADAPKVPRSRTASQSSTPSQGSVVHSGTVAQKQIARPSSADGPIQNTPEWKRRLLKGQGGYGEQKDLFSPMALENIFQKPDGSTPGEPEQPKSKLGVLKSLSAIPSSPPPWPARDQDVSGYPENSEREVEAEAESTAEPVQAANSSSRLSAGNNKAIPRTVSGQIEFENENFSPVYLSMNLGVGSSAPSIPTFTASSLAERLRTIGTPPPIVQRQPASEGDSTSQNRSMNDSSIFKYQDDTLPADLPAGTPDIENKLSPYVEMRRGGYSQDDSFRRRPLSPSPQPKRTGRTMLTAESVVSPTRTEKSKTGAQEDGAAQPQSPSKRPVTPSGPQNSQFLSPERPQTAGSPLKLFDAHDTFTSNRLHRRLSQLELESKRVVTSDTNAESSSVAQKSSRMTSLEEVSMHQITTEPHRISPAQKPQISQRKVSAFGQGQLDRYAFPEDFSVLSSHSSEGQETSRDGSPSPHIAPPGSRQPTGFHFDVSPASFASSKTRRQGLTRVSNHFRGINQSRTMSTQEASVTEPMPALEVEHEYAEGKRGPTSPFKNPTPKRRRTLYSVTQDESGILSDDELRPTNHSHVAMQSALGQKRKDAYRDLSGNRADPQVIAQRQILRPRNPTPNHRMRDDILEATDAFIQSSPDIHTLREQLESSALLDTTTDKETAAVIAQEIADFTMKRPPLIRNESRKRSVTTQDFLDEAVKIMDYIRAKGRPTSGLESLEESASETPPRPKEDPLPSSPLSFSRPPTREGRRSMWKEPNKLEMDPKVMSHLRRFQERESDELMGSSMRSLQIPQALQPIEGKSVVVEQNNIRITDNIIRHREGTEAENANGYHAGTIDTHRSGRSSMGQTIATNASRKSEHVATLAPEAVAHLIPEHIAGMSFDREKNAWVRNKAASHEHHTNGVAAASEDSEEDPLGNIPDLTVDETAEIMLKNQESPSRPQATAETFLEDTEGPICVPQDDSRPVTREGRVPAPTDTSSVPSKSSNNFGWSYPKTETRATSWSDQETCNRGTQRTQHQPSTYPIPENEEVDVEHEIKYFEGRGIPSATRRVGDITFSLEGQRHTNTSKVSSGRQWSYAGMRHDSRPQRRPWDQAKGIKTLSTSPTQDLPDDGDLSTLHELPSRNYRMQLSISAPVLGLQGQDLQPVLPSSPAKADVTFMLSDLPEFTLHQVDECEIPDRVVVKHDGTRFSKSLEDRYAQGTADLVKALQDVAPKEPYWEDLRKVDLHNKGLTNLHRLDEFCYRLEELDVSDNGISQVKGIPYSVRRLRVAGNVLTGLTSWTTLMNLQYLDISGNEIDSLDGMSELIHLRTLKADSNHIKSLDGIMELDGLMELSASGNQIEVVDFTKADLISLTDLNLAGNSIVEVRKLGRLPQLRTLNLDDNCIEDFPIADIPDEQCKALRSLRLCRNGMRTLDIGHYCPRLESLYVDGNHLPHIPGLERLRCLRTFSAREQAVEDGSANGSYVGDLLKNHDVRNLYLSVNPIRGLELSQHLLNLQRLELSSMGLEELPIEFGQLAPNLRSINLNFNSLKDLRPLLNIKRLTELFVAGNKLTRLRTNLAVLGKLTTLTTLDLRDNPLTLRFYPPTSEKRVMSLRHKPSEETDADRFVLPPGDPEADKQYLQRLDFETRLRRRVQEIMLSTQCRNLRELDGLPFDRTRILVKDDIWDRLSYLGVIRRAEVSEQDRSDDYDPSSRLD